MLKRFFKSIYIASSLLRVHTMKPAYKITRTMVNLEEKKSFNKGIKADCDTVNS